MVTYTLEEEEESDEENEIEEKKDDDINIDIYIEIPKEMKENWNNKDIKEILKELFPDEKIELKLLKENIENNNYTNELKNLYQIISEIIGDDPNSNDVFNFEGMMEIFSINENILNDFKKYYILKKMNEYKIKAMKERKKEATKKRKEEKEKLKESLKELLNIKLKIIKKIELPFIKAKYAVNAIDSLIILDKKIGG